MRLSIDCATAIFAFYFSLTFSIDEYCPFEGGGRINRGVRREGGDIVTPQKRAKTFLPSPQKEKKKKMTNCISVHHNARSSWVQREDKHEEKDFGIFFIIPKFRFFVNARKKLFLSNERRTDTLVRSNVLKYFTNTVNFKMTLDERVVVIIFCLLSVITQSRDHRKPTK